MFHTGYIACPLLRLTRDQLDGASGDPRCPDSMCLELDLEPYTDAYVADSSVNRMEVYESLLFDTNSALWREVLHRKERRAAPSSPPAEKVAAEQPVFDIDSDEEEPVKRKVPAKDPARDYMTELALLESTLTQTQEDSEKEKGLTEAEEQNLDSIMQELDIDSDGEDVDSANLDLNDIAGSIDLDEDDDEPNSEARDFSAEFGV